MGRPLQVADSQQQKERVLNEALDEYCRLRDAGSGTPASVFCQRFPTYRKSLRRLIDVHDTLDQFADVDEDEWPTVGTEFLGFEILHELGMGAIARVYLASEPALGGRLVAIKVAFFGGDEAETLGKLAHANVVPVHSIQRDTNTGMTAVCMPYLGSATLADVLELAFENDTPPKQARTILQAVAEREQLVGFTEVALKDLPRDRMLEAGSYVDGVIHLGIQMAEALAYTHEQGVLHRDLKPSNVLMTADGCPMLLDFNLSCDLETDVTRLGGTLPYMPPEQINDVFLRPFEAPPAGGDPRSDVFALGVILYELLTGRLPFGEPPEHVIPQEAAREYLEAQSNTPTPIRKLNSDVDRTTALLVERCLALNPDHRPPTAAAVVVGLRRYFAAGSRARRWSRRHWLVVSAAVATALLLSALTIWHFSTPAYLREYDRGLRDLKNERFADAAEHFDRSFRQQALLHTLFARGIANLRLGEYESAIQDLKRVKKNSLESLVNECLAYACLKSESKNHATACYRELVTATPHKATAHLNYGVMRYHHKPEEAIQLASTALQLDPTLASAYQLRAQASLLRLLDQETGSADEIIDDLKEAERYGAANPYLALHMALALSLSDPESAEREEEVRRYLELAVGGGISGATVQSYADGVLLPWSDKTWFDTVRKTSLPPGSTVPDAALVLVAPPDPGAVIQSLQDRRLRTLPVKED